MTRQLEVFADITCPFTHVGLRTVVDLIAGLDGGAEIIVRAWPLEWVNDAPLDVDAVAAKIEALRHQLGIEAFAGFRPAAWPATTIPALNLAASAFAVDPATGLRVSLAIRDTLFEDGRDVNDPAVLAELAAANQLPVPGSEPSSQVEADYAEGRRRGVRGSPDFWVGDDEFFCPALRLGHDDTGLVASFDMDGLRRLVERLRDQV